MQHSNKGLNLSYLLISLLFILLASEAIAAENLQQDKVIKATKNAASSPKKIMPVGKTNSNKVTSAQRATTKAKISNKKSYQFQAGPIKPNKNIPNQQGRPVQLYGAAQGPAKPVSPDGAIITPAPVVQIEGIRVWKIDESGNRVEGQGTVQVLEGPAR